MRNLLLITKEDFVNLVKNPMWVFYATGFPILLVLIIGYLTRDAYGGGFSSFDYYGITLMIYAAVNSGMTAANAFMEERIKHPNMRIIYAPGSLKNLYLSKIIASFLFSLVFHLFDMILLCLVLPITIRHPLFLFLLGGLSELFFVILGVLLCCIIKSEAMTNQLQSIVVNLLALLGGALFSLDSYGSLLRSISMLSPVKWIIKSAFELIYDQSFTAYLPTTICLAIGCILMLLICGAAFHKEDCIC